MKDRSALSCCQYGSGFLGANGSALTSGFAITSTTSSPPVQPVFLHLVRKAAAILHYLIRTVEIRYSL
jgi:hypothetical protein